MSDVTTVSDLETNKKHLVFCNEVITGKGGGLASGADIATATNEVTGQIQKTLPKVIEDLGPQYFADWPGAGDPSVTLTNAGQALRYQLADGGDGHDYCWSGAFPKTVSYGSTPTPLGSGGWIDRSDVTLGNRLGDFIPRLTLAELASAAVSVGDTVQVTDRDNALFLVKAGTADGYFTVTAGAHVAEMIARNNEITSAALGMTEGQDVTAMLTAIAPKIKSNNVTSIKMSVNASFTGVLPFEYNCVAFGSNSLTGIGRLAINSTSNIIQALQNTHSPYKVYSGKLNGMLLDNQNTKSAIEVRKEIRIVLLGDSIGVTSDWDSQAVSAGERMIQGVDNFSTVNAFGFLLFQEICAAVGSGVRVKFYSRCVGGKSYANLGAAWDSVALSAPWSGREQCTPGKAWVNCVLDLEPDLVIHEMGMNHGATDYFDGFVTNWYNKLIETGRVGTFDQALVTTPSPNFEDAGVFGDFRPFCTPMFYVALQQRYVANKYGMSLIDVSFLSFLKRYGIDPRNCVMSKDYKNITIDGGSSVTIAAGGGKAFQHPNNPIFHQTTLTINQAAGAALDFRVNFGDGVIVQFGKTSISIINGFFSSMSTSKSVAYAMPDNTDVTFTIQVMPHGVFVFAGNNGNTLLLVNDITAYKTTVGGVMQNSSATGSVTVKDVKIFEGEFPRYASDTSTIEMYGVLDYTQNPFGGGINHPSNKGLAEIYTPPVREFCARMTEGNRGQYINNQISMSNNDLIYIGSVEATPYSVSEFWDDASLSYLRIKYGSGGALSSVENRTGMSIYHNARGDIYAKISGGRNIRGLRYSGCWRKFGGWVVNSVHAPLRLTGFTEVVASFSTAIETITNGKITRIDVVEVSSGTTFDFPLDFTPNIFVGAKATISANSETAQMTQLNDTVQVTSSSTSGKLHYHCTFATSAATTPRRIMFESTYILK